MNIYRDYTSDDVLEDSPCFILGCGLAYPLRVKGYIKFITKYGMYFMFSNEGLDLQLAQIKDSQERSLLSKTIFFNVVLKSQKDVFGQSNMDSETAIKESFKDLENALSIVFKKQIKYNEIDNSFYDKDKSVVVNENNFADVRKVIAMQNLIKEPQIYEDPEYAELMYEARRQKNKKNGGNVNISEMIAYVKNYGKLKYEDIYSQNILQLYSDYRTMTQMEYHRTIMNFKLVSSEVGNTSLAEGFMDDLFKAQDDSDLLRDSSYLYDNEVFK